MKGVVKLITFRFLKLLLLACCGGLNLLAAAPFPTRGAGDSGAGPSGINVGFNFNWGAGPAGYTASYITSSSGTGGTTANCGPVQTTETNCDFVFSYSIGGTPQTPVAPGGVYSTWTGTCDSNPADSAPLTEFNCFNSGSFGQIFLASATGLLTSFSMPMTCLNPAGTPPTGLIALIYQVNIGSGTLPAAPLAQAPVNLTGCPTLTSWTGHAFSGADFATIPINFSGVTLTAGNLYGVYFGGLTPGSQPPGVVLPVPTLSEWGMILLALMLVGFGVRKLRRPAAA